MLTFQRGVIWIVGLLVHAVFHLHIINLTSQYASHAGPAARSFHGVRHRQAHAVAARRRFAGRTDLDGHVWIRITTRASLYAAADTSVTRGFFFGWDKGNLKCIAAYFRVLDFDNVRAAPTER